MCTKFERKIFSRDVHFVSSHRFVHVSILYHSSCILSVLTVLHIDQEALNEILSSLAFRLIFAYFRNLQFLNSAFKTFPNCERTGSRARADGLGHEHDRLRAVSIFQIYTKLMVSLDERQIRSRFSKYPTICCERALDQCIQRLMTSDENFMDAKNQPREMKYSARRLSVSRCSTQHSQSP